MSELLGKKVLVVDDEEMIREIIIEMLASSGALALGAPGGDAAFELLRQQKFDFVITDVRMPDGDGLSLLKRIDELGGNKPKLFLCSAYNDVSAEEARRLGVLDIFSKPFKRDRIIQALAQAL